MRGPVLLLLLAPALAASAGCASPPTEDGARDDAAVLPAPAPVDLWDGTDRHTVVDLGGSGQVTMFDVACALGGAPIFEGEGYVLPGTTHLEVGVSVGGAMTHLQVGHGVVAGERGGRPVPEDIVWLDPVGPAGTATFQVPVTADQTETPDGPRRWAFSYRNNPGVEELCYTGGGSGTFRILVEAVRGAAADAADAGPGRGGQDNG